MSVLLARLEVRWFRGKLFFFDPESGLYLGVFRPYPEIANLSITIERRGSQIGSGSVWISDRRRDGSFELSFIGFEDYFGVSERRGCLRFDYLAPLFFAPGDALEIHDAMNNFRFFYRKIRRQRFIEAVFRDFMANSLYGIEGVELLWDEFLSKYTPSHVAIAAMLSISRRDEFLFLCLCGNDEISNADIIQGNQLWDQWISFLDTWRQAAISQEYPFGVLSLRGE